MEGIAPWHRLEVRPTGLVPRSNHQSFLQRFALLVAGVLHGFDRLRFRGIAYREQQLTTAWPDLLDPLVQENCPSVTTLLPLPSQSSPCVDYYAAFPVARRWLSDLNCSGRRHTVSAAALSTRQFTPPVRHAAAIAL